MYMINHKQLIAVTLLLKSPQKIKVYTFKYTSIFLSILNSKSMGYKSPFSLFINTQSTVECKIKSVCNIMGIYCAL